MRFRRLRFFKSAELGLLLGSVVVGLLLIEAALRIFSPVEMRIKGGETLNLPFFKTYNLRGGKNSKLEREFRSSRNSLGFRGREPPQDFPNYLSIVAVGGSTTESFYVADGATWPEVVGDLLNPVFDRLWVNNAGLMGHSTFGHLVLLRQHVAKLAPKAALFLVGINDRSRSRLTDIENDMKRPRRKQFAIWLLRHSELASLVWLIWRTSTATNLGISNEEIDFKAVPMAAVTEAARAAELAKHGDVQMEAYAARLREMIKLSRDADILPIFITQPVVYGPAVDDVTGVDLGRIRIDNINGSVAWEVLELYNDVTRRVAGEAGVDLIELARTLPKSSRFYYDNIHFTREGSKAVAEVVARQLCPILADRFPDRLRGTCGVN